MSYLFSYQIFCQGNLRKHFFRLVSTLPQHHFSIDGFCTGTSFTHLNQIIKVVLWCLYVKCWVLHNTWVKESPTQAKLPSLRLYSQHFNHSTNGDQIIIIQFLFLGIPFLQGWLTNFLRHRGNKEGNRKVRAQVCFYFIYKFFHHYLRPCVSNLFCFLLFM